MSEERKKLVELFDDIYEEVLVGFMLELQATNTNGREIGERLAKLMSIMEVWDV